MPQPRRSGNREEPVRQSVRLSCPAEQAFRLFTERFGEWWPLSRYSVAGEQSDSCTLEPWPGGRVFERTKSGQEHEWGEVVASEPPNRLEFVWDPAGSGDRRERVEVRFVPDVDGTRVILTHLGWHTSGVAVCLAQMPGSSSSAHKLRHHLLFRGILRAAA